VVDEIAAVSVRLSSRSFFQSNRMVAALAYSAIADGLAPLPGADAVDLYAGAGAIAFVLAARGARVVGIEEIAAATADASAVPADGARFVTADAAAGLRDLPRADVVALDPPRRGCDAAVMAEIARLAPRAVAYLSCNPE